MPMVRSTGPPEPRNHSHVVRTESIKSERSDKRVSFNKDVGVKHIPRGHKGPQTKNNNNNSNVVIRSAPSDEWANCFQVHREHPPLSSQELEQEAADLLKLVDNVNCESASNRNTRSLDRPSKSRNNKNATAHQNYNNVVFNNVRNNRTNNNLSNNNNNNKNINVINGEPRGGGGGGPRTLTNSRTTNPINRRVKGDINQTSHRLPLPQSGHPVHHHRSVDHLPDSELDSPHPYRRQHQLAAHTSVPDLNTVYYNNKDAHNYKYRHLVNRIQDPSPVYKSVDNLYNGADTNSSVTREGQPPTGYKSVDNLVESGPVTRKKLQGFKSVGHLPGAGLSDNESAGMSRQQPYKPKVGNIIKKFNAETSEVHRSAVMVNTATEMDNGGRGTLEPDRYRNHNNNQPFSYTGTTPLASVQAVRRLSPPRDLISRNSPPRDLPVYAQVNKDRVSRHEADRNYHNSRQEREYSAKIIITDKDHRPSSQDEYDDHSPYRSTPPKNNYHDDDHAYESYQVPEDNLRRLRMLSSDDLMDEYKEHSSNNINMSSVGVQTDALPKAPSRSRKTHKSPASSPPRHLPHHAEKIEQKQNFRQQKQQSYYANQKQHQQQRAVKGNIHNNLTSATLVRQVNHGFGRTDRSPSPPPRVSAARQPRRNVVPLLSDTSDSEGEHRRKSVDPLARIRDQVMQREKLQEQEEEEEARVGRKVIQDSVVMPYRAEQMTPLTIDEVDALSLVMEDNGRKSLVVSNQTQATSVTHTSNHRSRRSETVTERIHPANSKDSLSRPQKPPRDKNHTPRAPTPTRKDPVTLEKNKKNNLEKERASKAAKQKEEKKDKKKKRIKIKFFYDPRPQDDPNDDPLSRFTEFKGTSSDERGSPRNDRQDDRHEDRSDGRREKYEEHKEEYRNDRRNELNEYRQRRDLPDVLEDTTSSKDRRGSRENLDSTPRPKRNSRDSREMKMSRETSYDSQNGYNSKRRDSRGSRDSRDNRIRETSRSRSRDDRLSYDESADERRNNYDRDDPQREYDDDDERGSPDGRAGKSLSDKYRSGLLYEPANDDPPNNANTTQPIIEEDEKQEKIMRQRKKFFSALISDGRSKVTSDSGTSKGKKTSERAVEKSKKKQQAPKATSPPPKNNPTPDKAKQQTPAKKKSPKKKRAWPWALLGLRGGARGGSNSGGTPQGSSRIGPSSRVSSRASSRASSRSSHRPGRPSVRASKIHRDGPPVWFNRDREEDAEERLPNQQWESSTLSRAELRARKDARQGENRGFSTVERSPTRKYSGESSASSGPPPPRVAHTTSFKHRYFGDTDIESNHGGGPRVPEYRSLPNRASRSAHKMGGKGRKPASGLRGMSPPAIVVGSAGSSLHSSESEVDSHGGSHASRASKASHMSTGSNRSVYLHATAVADIPVRRGQEEAPSERSVNRQSRKVSRSFSLMAPWKPRHYREKFEVDYDNRDSREANNSKGALPPRPPRRSSNDANDSKKVNRTQSMYKDSRLAGWLRRRRNKEAKGI